MDCIKRSLITILFLLITGNAAASERIDHFEGESAQTWQQAIDLLRKANQELALIAQKPELSLADSAKIHELSYSMENALARLSQQLSDTGAVLEELHLSSETPNLEQTRELQQRYLTSVAPITQSATE